MLLEHQIVPYKTSLPKGNRVLILAPHPDDETFGCGGTLLQLIEMNKSINVIFLTSGDKADPNHIANQIKHGKPHITDYSLMREDEAKLALNLLKITDYTFLRYPDRELEKNYNQIYKELAILIAQYRPDTIYTPSPIELNPDHRISAKIALNLQRNITNLKVVFYEVTTPLRPNLLVNISQYYETEIEALNKYGSQISLNDYTAYITALNKFRGLTVSHAYCEAFWFLEKPVSDDELCKWLCYISQIDNETD
ncbi:MAG: PIG-L family deacetylase [Thermodesulfovibrionales bacterium]|nr:PIG-L family deacetylase [Thermodesulfovibrionales bacterium]